MKKKEMTNSKRKPIMDFSNTLRNAPFPNPSSVINNTLQQFLLGRGIAGGGWLILQDAVS